MSQAADTDTRPFVIFRLGDEEYGLAIDRVRSIIRFEQATPVPRSAESVLGVINLRGTVIPVLDLASRLNREAFVPAATSRIVVAEAAIGLVGLAVDAASEVTNIPVDAIKPTPESVLTADTVAVFEGVAERDGKLTILIDLDEAIPRTQYVQALSSERALEGDLDV
ncbi:MAG: chemotaxis protein CheW [Coriobacteriia bacterium]|nr:chemotaxis protein CheW [Coriobacteriia bacterium]